MSESKQLRKSAELRLLEIEHRLELPAIIAPLLEQGMGRDELSAALGFSRRTVDNWLALYGMKVARRYWLVKIAGREVNGHGQSRCGLQPVGVRPAAGGDPRSGGSGP